MLVSQVGKQAFTRKNPNLSLETTFDIESHKTNQ